MARSARISTRAATRTFAPNAPPASLSLTLQFGRGIRAEQFVLSRARIRRLILAALSADCSAATITLRVVGNAESQALNTNFRDKEKPTNILTFSYAGPPQIHADLVLCLPVCRQEARAQSKALDHHLAHMVIHGTLHACGLDHENDADATAMEALEQGVLKRFRIANPYSVG
jgi:probable rRNA maturation factor